jgi:hypothetical protein
MSGARINRSETRNVIKQESDLTGEAPLLRELPFLRSYTLPGLPNETYLYFEGRPALVGRRSADA